MADIAQGSQEWFALRMGKATASRVSDIMARTKSGGVAASRANYKAQLVVERLTGVVEEGFTSPAMEWGKLHEADARDAYAFQRDVIVREVPFIDHPSLPRSGASPDGVIGDDGLLEIKCPNTATHIETLRNGTIADKYIIQMQWQLACTRRDWCDFVSFDPRMPPEMRLYVKRIARDADRIAELEREVGVFLKEVEDAVDDLNATYRPIVEPEGFVNPMRAG